MSKVTARVDTGQFKGEGEIDVRFLEKKNVMNDCFLCVRPLFLKLEML